MPQGILYRGRILPVPGVHIDNPTTAGWAKLSGGDYAARVTSWVRQLYLHTTKGIDKQIIRPGAGPSGRDKNVADFWFRDPLHSAAPLVVDSDGTAACLGDIASVAAYHATTANDWSTGIEIYQEADGSIYEAALDTTVKLVLFLTKLFGIPFQIASDPYVPKTIIERLKFGGPDCVGVFGHRHQAWKFPQHMTPDERRRYPNGYAARSFGDPGDEVFNRLVLAGADRWNYAAREDIAACKRVQTYFNVKKNARLTVDGVYGPSTHRFMAEAGYTKLSEVPLAA